MGPSRLRSKDIQFWHKVVHLLLEAENVLENVHLPKKDLVKVWRNFGKGIV
jgi:hypothetical protein